MNLIVGLGNPGEKYSNTRHNIGFLLVDNYVLANSLEWKEEKRFNGLVAISGDNIFLGPQTFMNESGMSVSKCLNFYKIPIENLFVIHDDVDLEFGKVKKQFGAGTAGHHGVEDIVEKLGTKEFWRIRVGAGRPKDNRFDVYDWVLSKFTSEENKLLKSINLDQMLTNA